MWIVGGSLSSAVCESLNSFHKMRNHSASVRRLDEALVERGLCESRERAKRAVLAGMVSVNGERRCKPGDRVHLEDEISMIAAERYVSRGGYKLEHALKVFGIDVRGMVALDLGASTGGFTDCLLQHGAAKVYAVDVGHGLLAWKLRNDKRVVVMEGVNGRYLEAADFPEPFDGVDVGTIDCSFISLRHLLVPVGRLVKAGGFIVPLVKPQFEAGKLEADRGRGVIRDPEVRERVLAELKEFVGGIADLRWRAETESPILGPAGNREYLVLIEKTR